VTGSSLKDHVDALHRYLLAARREGRDVVLLIDEAQDLAVDVLEQIRLISNLETDTEKLIQIVLMGQSELRDLLARHDLRQLAQRVTARYHLTPLDRAETGEYVRHRLTVAGGEGKVSFTPAALDAVFRASGGVPRVINLVCDRALLAGFVEGRREIGEPMVRAAAAEVLAAPRPRVSRRGWALLAAAGAMGALAPVLIPRPSGGAAPAPPVAAPSPAPADVLDPLILSLERGASFDGAVEQVQALWEGQRLERTALRTHLDQVRRLDLPVVLEMFHPSRRDSCYLALLRLEGGAAFVSGGGGGVRVPVEDLDRRWTRQALFLWRDFDGLGGAQPARTAEWTRERLSALGYRDADLARAVAAFQRGSELAPDGVVGARTLMTLYSLGTYSRPRLMGGS
jgi:general secretion pathway protein A